MADEMDENRVYTKLNNSKELFDLTVLLKKKIRDLKLILDNIDDLNEREEAIISEWNAKINDLNGKIEDIDEQLKPEWGVKCQITSSK